MEPLIGAYKCYLSVQDVAVVEVWETGNQWAAVATLRVTDRDGQPIRRPLCAPVASEREAREAMEEWVAKVGFVSRSVGPVSSEPRPA